MYSGAGKVAGLQVVRQPFELFAGVAEGDCPRSRDIVQIEKSVELPLLLDHDVELSNTLGGKPIFLGQDADRIMQKLGGDLKNVLGHSSR